MKKRLLSLNIGVITMSMISLVGCSGKSYEKTDNAVIVNIDSTKIRLQVINSDIIRVSATKEEKLPGDTSLMVIPRTGKFTNWTVSEDTANVIVKTPSLVAELNKKTGAVTFKDSAGTVLLQEKQAGAKTFTKSATPGANYFKVKDVFESPADEAFFGLGGHQHGYMNYKGKDVDLTQHNMVPCIPFFYSSKNYGILWDNYSITRFGDSRDYQQISGLQLFDKEGKPGGLTATYSVSGKVVETKVENTIDFTFDEEPAQLNLSKDVDTKGTIVWEGSMASDVEGKHKFLLYASSYFKLWIDGKLVFDKWRQNWNPWSNPFEVNMNKGEKHNIKIEWVPNGGYMGLTHLDPLSVEDQNRLSLYSEAAHAIDYYFVRGNNADQVISGYRTITGKAPIVPKWAMGFWQSRERYKTQAEILETVKTFRDKHIPLDNIVLDWMYWPEDKWGAHEFDSTRFPKPGELTQKLHNDYHANIMISVWAKYYEGIEHYKEMDAKGYMYHHNLDKKRLDWVGKGYLNTDYDVFNPDARNMFWKQINEHIYTKGFDAWWLDATEPDMHSNISIEERKLNMTPTHLGLGEEFFNAFALMQAKGVYESQRATNPSKRVFILTRSVYAGQQHYGAATWSGDITSRWSDMKDQISNGVNFCISGIPYWTMDIGGFALEDKYYNMTPAVQDEWRELQERWYQFGSFCPLFRAHGQFPLREIFNIAPEGHPAYNSILYYNKLRYKLMPYTYTLAGMTYHDDYTIMRGLVMDFNKDKNVYGINDQFMYGPSLLINPVTEYKARERELYLPAGQGWFDLYTGKFLDGGQTIKAPAPYEQMPVYVKEGSIIPTGADMEYTNQYPDSVITLYVYGGKDASFKLYSDEATNYNYEKGACTFVPLTYSEQSGTLTIGKRQGEYSGMLKEQTFKVIFISKEKPLAFGNEKSVVKTIVYKGEKVNEVIK